MLTQNFGADLSWDHETNRVVKMTTADVVEDFNSPLWVGATNLEIRMCWDKLVRKHSKNGKSSLDF